MIAAFDYKRFKQRHLRPAFSWLRSEKRFWSRASECQEAYQITVEIMSGILQVYSKIDMHRIGEMGEKMRYTRPDPFDMIESLSLEEKKSLLGYLSDSIRKMEASATKMTYLEERWMEIKRLMKSLDYEPYIDDQVEIEEIWDICEDLIKSGKIQDTSWAIRQAILQDIIEGEYFDEYGVFDPMKQLFSALCISKKERITSADMCFEFGSGYMKKDGAKVYLECGLPEKYYDYLETCLSRDGKLYEELIMYYKDRDYEKALEIAELAMKKCKENLTETVIFLLQDAESKQDSAKYTRLMKSAKLRYAINYQEVLERMEK